MNIERNEERQLENDTASIGVLLKQTRQELGLTIEEVAERLKLRVTVVREIEDNCCDDSQTTFVRGYIRSYAKLVGLDADKVLNTYVDTYQVETIEHQMQSFSKKTSRQQLDNRVMNLTWVIFSVVVGITAIWWWQNQPRDELITSELAELENTEFLAPETDSSSSTSLESNLANDSTNQFFEEVEVNDPDLLVASSETEMPINAELVTQLPNDGDVLVETVEPQSSVTKDIVAVEQVEMSEFFVPDKEGSDSLVSAEVVTDSDAEQVTILQTMQLTFTDECWVDIQDANGKKLLMGIKSVGDNVELKGEPPFKLVIGAPLSVNLIFEGEDIDLSKYSPRQVARFTLPK